jgi:pilus assembly protein Flp/PilA
MFELFRDAMRDQSGATAIEYSLIAGGIAMAVIGAATLAGGSLAAWFQRMADAL